MEAFDNGFRTGPYCKVRPGPEPVIERYRGPAYVRTFRLVGSRSLYLVAHGQQPGVTLRAKTFRLKTTCQESRDSQVVVCEPRNPGTAAVPGVNQIHHHWSFCVMRAKQPIAVVSGEQRAFGRTHCQEHHCCTAAKKLADAGVRQWSRPGSDYFALRVVTAPTFVPCSLLGRLIELGKLALRSFKLRTSEEPRRKNKLVSGSHLGAYGRRKDIQALEKGQAHWPLLASTRLRLLPKPGRGYQAPTLTLVTVSGVICCDIDTFQIRTAA
ncbi:hypothetical protein Bbelb_105570 [Branchiostoma belcheri]|nr:hypothetical protein Bbelb_105570 [Branchiostoma belcheri]